MTEHEPRSVVTEQEGTPEYLGRENIGLQARLLLGDFTDQTLTINRSMFQPIKEQGAQGIDSQVAKRYQQASFTQRLSYQEQTGLTYERWKKGFNKYLQKIRDTTDHPEQKEFLETLGITATFSAEEFYNEYLRGKSDVIKFVDDVETLATREQIRANEDVIRAIGNSFGFESSEVIDNLIRGVSNVKYNLDGFVKRAKRSVNIPRVLNNPLFEKILEDSQEEEEIQVAEGKVSEKPEVPHRIEEDHISESMEGEPEQKQEEPPSAAEQVSPLKTEVQAEEQVLEEGGGSILSHMGEEPVWTDQEEVQPSPEEELLPQQEEILIFPAPVLERKRDDSPLTPEEVHLAVTYLFFNDVSPHDETRQALVLKSSEAAKYYVRELRYMMDDYGQDFVLQKAGDAILSIQQDLSDISLKRDKHSKSQSWYLWHISKSRFLANNPDIQQRLPNAEHYRSFDPLLHYAVGIRSTDGRKSQQAEEDVFHATLGWEVYRQRNKLGDILMHLNPLMDPRDKKRLRVLLEESPRDEEPKTLSAYKLREIGELVKKNKMHR